MIIANMISARHFAKQSHAKNRIGYRNAGGHPKCDKFIINFYIMDNLSCRFDIMDNESYFLCFDICNYICLDTSDHFSVLPS